MQFEDMVYQQILEMGTNCAPLIADLFLFLHERDFMSNRHTSKLYDLIDMFAETSQHLDDIFTVDNLNLRNILLIYFQRKLRLNKANTSDKETSFLELNIKVIGSNVHTRIYDKRNDFVFPIVNFSWLGGDVPTLQSYGIYIFQFVRFDRCCTSILDFHSKNYLY